MEQWAYETMGEQRNGQIWQWENGVMGVWSDEFTDDEIAEQ